MQVEEGAMKKIINQPEAFVDEMLAGLLEAHPDQLRAVTDELLDAPAHSPFFRQ